MADQSVVGTFSDQSSVEPVEGVKQYHVQSMSDSSAFIFVFAGPLLVFLDIKIAMWFGGSAVAFVFGVIGSIGLMVYLFQYLQQKILVTVGHGSISIHYLRSPFFGSPNDMDLVLADVESYKFDTYSGVRFTLYLKDGRRFRVAMGRVGKSECLKQMAEHIISLLADSKYSKVVSGTSPRRRSTWAEGTSGLVLAIFLISAMVALALGLIFFRENHNASDTVRGFAAMSTCLAFVLHIFRLRRKGLKKSGT